MKVPEMARIEQMVREFLEIIGENPDRRELRKTPSRVAKAIEMIFGGYKENPDDILSECIYEASNNQLVLCRDIEFMSICEHHIMPFFGFVHIGYVPDKKIVGLSKLAGVVDIFSRRLQVQERLTEEIAYAIKKSVSPLGIGVVIKARHLCMEICETKKKEPNVVTSFLDGVISGEGARKEEFLNAVFGKRLDR
jgi:GTP cyclohydrolase I